MKKILSLSALALVLSGCSSVEKQGSKPVSTTGESTKESTTVTTTTTKTPETSKEETTEKKEENKISSQFSAYVGTYTGENGSVTLNEDGSITEGNQTHKPVEVSTENGGISIMSNLHVGQAPVQLYVFPAGTKGNLPADTSKNRIEKHSKGGSYVFTQGGSSSSRPSSEPQTIPGGGFGRVSADEGTKTVLPGAGAVVRKGSTTESAALTTLKKGTRVYVDKVVTNPYGESWTMIMVDGDYGFIRSDLLG